MTLADAFVYIAAWAIGIGVICWLERRRDRVAAKAKHPSAWSDATEAAIVQAVGVVDDGKALVRETEAFLEGRSR
jgi:hypothetical protein